jgi:hypothetical protein
LRLAPAARAAVLAAVVAAAWLAVYAAFTVLFPDGPTPIEGYRYRDDALVTLSHARGLVDVGTVSVNVAGSRVEGYSAPLQFALATAYYALGGSGFHRFLDAQVWICTALLGAAVFLLLALATPGRSLSTVAAAAAVVSVPVFGTFSFFGWHSSGMENAITNALAAGTIALLALAVRRAWVLPLAGLAVALFALSRVEFVVHAAPLAALTALWLLARGRGFAPVAALAAPALVLWASAQLARIGYFGSFFPNTAEAQGISPLENLALAAQLSWPLALPLIFAVGVMGRRRRLDLSGLSRMTGFWILSAIGAALALFLLLRAGAAGALPSLPAFLDVALALGIWWWLLLALGLALLARGPFGLVFALLAMLLVTGTSHLLVFGPARLTNERVVSFVLVPAVCLVAALALRLDPASLHNGSRAKVKRGGRTALALGLLSLGLLGAWSSRNAWHAKRGLCCDLGDLTDRIEVEASKLQQQTGLPVVSVANADLGLLSFGKRFNITDLGGLGDPIIARIWRRGVPERRMGVVVDYLNHYAVPDVVEIHGLWSCTYAAWRASEEFSRRYRQVWDDGWTSEFARGYCPQRSGAVVRGGIWVRADLVSPALQREVALSRRLASDPDPALVRRELEACTSEISWSCQYVTRSVLRNLQALDQGGHLDALLALFRGRPTAAYDEAVLTSRRRGDWYRPAADFVRGAQTEGD